MHEIKESQLYLLIEKYFPDECDSWYKTYIELDAKLSDENIQFNERNELYNLRENHIKNMWPRVHKELIEKHHNGWL